MLKFKVKKDGPLLDAMLDNMVGISKQKAKRMLFSNTVICNGKAWDKQTKPLVKKGDLIDIIKTETPSSFEKEQLFSISSKQKVKILFEDQQLLVAHKPAGIISSGETTAKSPSFHKVLEQYIKEREGNKIRLWIVHRLDREVEGLILFAKNETTMNALKDNWKKVNKKYLALTEGKPSQEEGTISSWLKDNEKTMTVSSSSKESEGAKWAETHYKYLEQIGPYFLMEVDLITGRKNQIRVHLSDIGCPIVGDRKYGADAKIQRQIRLIAYFLSFAHPYSGKLIEFKLTPEKAFLEPSKSNERYK